MGTETDTSSGAIAAATVSAEDAAFVERVEAIRKLNVDELKAKLPELELVALRALLVAEEAEGKAKARSTAVKAIEAAIDAHPEQIAVLASAQPPVSNEAPAAPVAPVEAPAGSVLGGVVEMEIDAGELGLDQAGPDAIAAAAAMGGVDPAIAAVARELGLDIVRFDDACDLWDDAKVLEHVLREGTILLIARREFAHVELTPIPANPSDFERAHDARRVVYTGSIELSGIGLAAALPIEQVWLAVRGDDGPVIIRRCDMAGALTLEPGRQVGFRPRTLIF